MKTNKPELIEVTVNQADFSGEQIEKLKNYTNTCCCNDIYWLEQSPFVAIWDYVDGSDYSLVEVLVFKDIVSYKNAEPFLTRVVFKECWCDIAE